MNEEQMRALLQKADQAAGPPVYRRPTAAGMRRRLHRRWRIRAAVPALAAAVVLVGTTGWIICMRARELQPETQTEPQRIASLEAQVKQLQAQTDTALKLVQKVLEQDRQGRRRAALAAELASIPDPLAQIDRQVDKTAFALVYQADRLYKELNQTESAIAAYKEVIQLFPKNRWADVARERLAEIEKRKSSQIGTPGESPWQT